ncbi:hypothetical protein DFQ26_002231 [Actinomortierella ambigua]|nr:hypothetical protein DFQ26_002231 [Actinomortierella ambigua]
MLLGSSLLATVHGAPAPVPTYALDYQGVPSSSSSSSSGAVESVAPTPTATVPVFFEHFPWPTLSHTATPEPTTSSSVDEDHSVPTPASPSPTDATSPTLAADPVPTPIGRPESGTFVSLPYDAPEMHFDDQFSDDDLIAVDDEEEAVGEAMADSPSTNRSVVSSRQKPYVNNWRCKPTPQKPAVVLVHSTLLTANSWDFIAPKLLKEGYCVFALTYGKIDRVPLVGGVDYLENSAAQLGDFVNQVLQVTNSTQVNLVGHSQGGIIGRYWMKFLDGQGKVKRYVGISPIQQGTTLSGIVLLGKVTGLFGPAQPAVDYFCPGCYQMVYDSKFMENLNNGGDTIPGVVHSNLATRTDQIVTPWRNSFQKGPSTNNILQDLCLLALNEHLTIITNPITTRWVLNQLDPAKAQSVGCLSFFG